MADGELSYAFCEISRLLCVEVSPRCETGAAMALLEVIVKNVVQLRNLPEIQALMREEQENERKKSELSNADI